MKAKPQTPPPLCRKRSRSSDRGLNSPAAPVGKPAGKKVKEATREELKGAFWLLAPKVPISDSPLHFGCPFAFEPAPSLSELVKKWNVPVSEVERIFQSWVTAKRRLESLGHSGKCEPTKKDAWLALVRSEFWESPSDTKTSERLRELSDNILLLEDAGYEVPLSWISRMLAKPPNPDKRKFREWLVNNWISPEGDHPPLCVCRDATIADIGLQNAKTARQQKRNPPISENMILFDGAIKQAVCELGLKRIRKGRLGKDWMDRQKT